jgi:hypothetical protein
VGVVSFATPASLFEKICENIYPQKLTDRDALLISEARRYLSYLPLIVTTLRAFLPVSIFFFNVRFSH